MSFRQTTVSGFPAIALRSDELEVVAVPTIGMKLTHLRRLRGREWLWRNGQIPLALPQPGASYVAKTPPNGYRLLPTTVMPNGDYELKVLVRDRVGGQVIENKSKFTITP